MLRKIIVALVNKQPFFYNDILFLCSSLLAEYTDVSNAKEHK